MRRRNRNESSVPWTRFASWCEWFGGLGVVALHLTFRYWRRYRRLNRLHLYRLPGNYRPYGSMHGRSHRRSFRTGQQGFIEVFQRTISQADRAHLEETYYYYTRFSVMSTIAMIEASLGIGSALNWIDEFDTDPLFRMNVWQIRAVYYLRQGDTLKAEECKRRAEMLQIEKSASVFSRHPPLTRDTGLFVFG